MTGLRQFISQEVRVKVAQGQLHELLLVNAEENREDVVSLFDLCSLKDDPIVGEPSWSFLKDSRNVDLQGHERWLLNRVASTDWLRDEFFVKSAKWSRTAAEHYLLAGRRIPSPHSPTCPIKKNFHFLIMVF
jgi:hypothetical protein